MRIEEMKPRMFEFDSIRIRPNLYCWRFEAFTRAGGSPDFVLLSLKKRSLTSQTHSALSAQLHLATRLENSKDTRDPQIK